MTFSVTPLPNSLPMDSISKLGEIGPLGLPEQKTFYEDELSKLFIFQDSLQRQTNWRKWAARILKAVVVFGGIYVAVEKQGAQYVGIAMAGAVAIDYIFSNQKLLTTLSAGLSTLNTTVRYYDSQYSFVKIEADRLKEQGESEQANKEFSDFYYYGVKKIPKIINTVKVAIEKADIDAITSLAHESGDSK